MYQFPWPDHSNDSHQEGAETKGVLQGLLGGTGQVRWSHHTPRQ